jgi:hypothetical protein
MTSPRFDASATLLQNGGVLAVGGDNNLSILSSAELYNPATGRWAATRSVIGTPNGLRTLVLTNGDVFAVLGQFAVTLLGTGNSSQADSHIPPGQRTRRRPRRYTTRPPTPGKLPER